MDVQVQLTGAIVELDVESGQQQPVVGGTFHLSRPKQQQG